LQRLDDRAIVYLEKELRGSRDPHYALVDFPS
jgi:hypothetical protein